MHSFQPSRGRVLFEFACALGIVASCVGAWKQTGASALLAAAAVAALYGFVHLFDLARPKPTEAVEPQRIDFEPETETDLPAIYDGVVPFEVADRPLMACSSVAGDDAEPAAPETKSGRRAKTPRKGGVRRASARMDEKVSEVVSPEAAAMAEFVLPEEAEVPELASQEELEAAGVPPPEETTHPHIAPLFEPEPFSRMPRRAFGRKSG